MKYRKKPVVIDAEQFTQDVIERYLFDLEPLPNGVRLSSASYHVKERTISHALFKIETLEGDLNVSVGDWIITGVHGETYACKPDIFEETYELVAPKEH